MLTKSDRKIQTILISVAVVLFMTACATIVGDKTQLMNFSSTPSEAKVVITDERGAVVFEGKTPTNVTLQKSDGSYWGKKSYTVKISKPGFAEQTVALTASANGWYIAGNLVFGGLIGWFIVDPFNGGMYTLSPKEVNATLTASSSRNNRFEDGKLAIMLLQDVPPDLRDKMVKIDKK